VVVVPWAVVLLVSPVDVEVVEELELDELDVVVELDAPHTDWPKNRSPTAVGPTATWWPAFTVSDPSGFVICSLKT